jgi:hypothetical protein
MPSTVCQYLESLSLSISSVFLLRKIGFSADPILILLLCSIAGTVLSIRSAYRIRSSPIKDPPSFLMVSGC